MIDVAWFWSLAAGALIMGAAALLFVRTRRRRTVFISYRRSDSGAFVAELYERLRSRFGSAVFRDQGSIQFGERFVSAITSRLREADVVLVVIGNGWLSATNEHGLRLQQPDDTTRREVEMALTSGARVIPILLDDTPVPSADLLPPSLRPLREANAMSIATDDLDGAVGALTANILSSPVQRTPWMELLAHASIVAIVLLFDLSSGFMPSEVAPSLLIVVPPFVATAAIALGRAFGTSRRRARAQYVPARALWVPLGLATVVAIVVAMKASNFLIDTLMPLEVAIAVVECLLGIHTGIVLSSLYENGRNEW